ncbi:ubiquitin conjugation factor E4 [Populus alba x Populus x berolinensis]|uniref:Ubiquitin conjugation factor E4 n=1 Tax=Populus alba x Populus x berolinensis TaxID=444605 RepID=A0AAD6R275_9ROSI|nr:ubiquitin conjugation factor E4 [Populus alba x Populus x berolinensis]
MATTSNKPQRSLQEIEDIILRRILSVSLADSSDPRIFYLEMTAAEILSEGKDLKLTRDLIERVLIDRLSVQSPNAEPPFNYLLGCYRRAVDELKKIANMKDKNVKSELELSIKQVKKLSVSYCRIHLGNPDLFGGDSSVVRKNGNSNVSPVLPLIFAMVDGFNSGGIQPPPPGFLEEFFREGDFDSLDPILKGLYEDLRGNVLKVSVLGNFQQPLRALLFLVSFNVGAKSLVSHKWWIPTGAYVNGRVIEMTSILGPFFHVSAWPDNTIFKSEPDVGQQCFSDATNHRPADLLSSFTTIKTLVNNLYDGLAEVLLALLKNGDTRESVLQYLAEVINRNATRAHIQVDPLSCASSGMFINLSAVMLKLSEPFLDANLSKRNKIDPNYVFHNNRLDLRGLTALLSSSEEITQWLNTPGKTDISAQSNHVENRLLQSQEATSSGSSGERSKYSFICECFFMTARVLNLGLLKAFSDFKHLVQEISRCEDMLSTFKALQEQTPSQQLQQDIDRLQKDIELYSQEKLCYEAQILRDGALIQRALSFYRLMLVWLVSLVGGFKMPLPSTCPKEFASMPEHFVEDAMELIIFASRIPKALDGVLLDDFMNFIIMFMASPTYIRNPYLRAKMVEVLNCWMPRRSGSSATASLFEGHQLSLEYLVRNLLKLYVDIELTGSHTQVPSHRDIWRKIAKEEEKGVYLNFLNFLINDSIYLLDESLSKILELKGLEAEMSNTTEWERRPAQERQERTRLFHSQENIIRIDMQLANEDVSMLTFTSEQITAPFLLPEMADRVANMLNYFLLQLVGPQRKSLTLKDPEKYEFRPKQLLKQVSLILQFLTGELSPATAVTSLLFLLSPPFVLFKTVLLTC